MDERPVFKIIYGARCTTNGEDLHSFNQMRYSKIPLFFYIFHMKMVEDIVNSIYKREILAAPSFFLFKPNFNILLPKLSSLPS